MQLPEGSTYSKCYACGSKEVVKCEFCKFPACRSHAVQVAENRWVCLRCGISGISQKL